MAKINDNKWSTENIEKVIAMKNSPEWDLKFEAVKGKARQTGEVWNAIAKEISEELTGVEVRMEYNYLFTQYKKHKLIADKSGEGCVRWRFYQLFKDSISRTPSIAPICVLDSSSNRTISADEHNNLELESIESSYIFSEKKNKKNKENYETKLLTIMEKRNEIIANILEKKDDTIKKTEEKLVSLETEVKKLNENFEILIKKLMKEDKNQ